MNVESSRNENELEINKIDLLELEVAWEWLYIQLCRVSYTEEADVSPTSALL